MTKKLSKNSTQNYIYNYFLELNNIYPNPQGELEHKDAFTLLVAVMLSAQTTDKAVNLATQKLFLLADNARNMRNLKLEQIISCIKSIGLYNNKAKNLLKLCDNLVSYHQGKVPATRQELMSLPGVGRKTANVVLNLAFGQKTIAVDTHVFRLSHRCKLVHKEAKTPFLCEKELETVIPDKFLHQAHLQLILHGRYICKAQKPKCDICPLNLLCRADINPYNKNWASSEQNCAI